MSGFDILVGAVGVAAGAVAAVAGFGVGSLLTPLLTLRHDATLAVALVSLPHAVATLVRLWRLRHDVNPAVLRSFGVASAFGGLLGAWLFTRVAGAMLARVLGGLLIFVGAIQLLGIADRWRFAGRWALVAGGVSGVFGGMVGNQGGIRSAGLLAFDLTPRQFVATAAAIALLVDAVRIPVYLVQLGSTLADHLAVIVVATAGVIGGTFAGTSLLLRLPPRTFRRVVGTVLVALGLWMWR